MRTRVSSAAETKNESALIAKKEPTETTASMAAASARPATISEPFVALTRPFARWTFSRPASAGSDAAYAGVKKLAAAATTNPAGATDQTESRPVNPGDCDRGEDRAAKQVAQDHRPPPVASIGGCAACERKEQRGQAVCEPHGDHAEDAACDDGDHMTATN
jgi:hypothetical protein